MKFIDENNEKLQVNEKQIWIFIAFLVPPTFMEIGFEFNK